MNERRQRPHDSDPSDESELFLGSWCANQQERVLLTVGNEPVVGSEPLLMVGDESESSLQKEVFLFRGVLL